jgi:hypothetical protein
VRGDGTQLFPCTLVDELSFSRSIGRPIIIANTDPRFSQGYTALATLGGFTSQDGADTFAHLTNIRVFPDTVAYLEQPPEAVRISKLHEAQYQRIISSAVGAFDEAAPAGEPPVSINDFTEQLRRQQRYRCSFSGVETNEGVAFIIQPLGSGGLWHVSNFLYLDPEPGTLFASFAWTVGPNLQILINTHAASPGLAEAVSRTGQLVLSSTLRFPPDRSALAWHREQFFARFKEEQSS